MFGSEGHSWQPVSDVTFFDQRDIYGSLSVTWHFWIRWRFLAACQWRDVLGSDGHSWQPVSDVTFFDQRDIYGSLSVTWYFWIRETTFWLHRFLSTSCSEADQLLCNETSHSPVSLERNRWAAKKTQPLCHPCILADFLNWFKVLTSQIFVEVLDFSFQSLDLLFRNPFQVSLHKFWFQIFVQFFYFTFLELGYWMSSLHCNCCISRNVQEKMSCSRGKVQN